ncbi:Pol polyprotein [Elysia marginata]|uniref:Pol polyprotein n=1 Tax=Elysia marginata TaxID=1093978 RepID=A0AAV4HW07_9GAST|nr:Pol polyprotein [Elysia marginata]
MKDQSSKKENKRIQKKIEELYRALKSLKDLVRHCNYKDEEDSTIRDRFVGGLVDQKLKEKLQLIHDLTLKKALETARQHELMKNQMKAQVDLDRSPQGRFTSSPPPKTKL